MTENEAKIFIQNAMEQSRNVLAELMLIMPKVFAAKRKSLGEYYSNLENCKKEIQSCEVAIKALEEVQRWHTSVINPNIKNEFANTSTQICHNCDHKDEYIEELEAEVGQYRTLEKRLAEMFGAALSLEGVIDELERQLKEPGNPHPINAKILTYEDAAAWDAYRAIGTPEELQKAEKEENILKFYYCDSEDSYLIGRRVGNFYYAHYLDGSWVFDMSRYLPWGIYINGREYPSEPREINFSEWLKGFVKKECGGTPEECRAAMEKQEPFKPETVGLTIGIGKCKCGVEFLDSKTDYCGNCGQKLDWSDEE